VLFLAFSFTLNTNLVLLRSTFFYRFSGWDFSFFYVALQYFFLAFGVLIGFYFCEAKKGLFLVF